MRKRSFHKAWVVHVRKYLTQNSTMLLYRRLNWRLYGVNKADFFLEGGSGADGFISDSRSNSLARKITIRNFYNKTDEMHQFLKFILFCSSTLHVSEGLSAHHQESRTVHTAPGICQTDSAECLPAGTRCSISFPLARSQQNLFHIYLML
jgi:hypothetical protein